MLISLDQNFFVLEYIRALIYTFENLLLTLSHLKVKLIEVLRAMPKRGQSSRKPFKPSTQLTQAIQSLLRLVEDDKLWASDEDLQLEKLFECVRRVEELQASQFPSVVPSRTQASLNGLVAWARDFGVDLAANGLRVSFIDGDTDNATLFATRSIPHETLLVEVPSRAMMTSAPPVHRPSLVALMQATPVLMRSPSLALSLILLAEAAAGAASPFAPYIAALPARFTTPFAAFDTPASYIALRPSPSATVAVRTLRAQLRDYTGIFFAIASTRPSDIPLQFLSLSNFRWVVSVIMTRQNALPAPGSASNVPPRMALVPFWDLFNHAHGSPSTSVVLRTGTVSIECRAMRNFNAGEPVTMFYGPRPNVQFALYSGFVYPNNPHDESSITINPVVDSLLIQLKIRCLEKKGFHIHQNREDAAGRKGYVVNINNNPSSIEKATAIAVVFAMDKPTFTTYLRNNDTFPNTTKLLRLQSLQTVEDALSQKLDQYGQTNQNPILRNSASSPNSLITDLHCSEKSLLQKALLYVVEKKTE